MLIREVWLPLHRALLLIGACALSACATLVQSPALSGPAADCQALFDETDARVREAGAGDPSLRRILGFPHLRTTRFLSSYHTELEDGFAFEAWVRELRAEDQSAREEEILVAAGKLQWEAPERELRQRLLECGEVLVEADLADPKRREHLRRAARVPDDYSFAQRLFGFYPLVAPFLKAFIHDYQHEVREDFAQPLSAPPDARLVMWQPRPSPLEPVSAQELAQWMGRASEHPLAIPTFSDEEIDRLIYTHAPVWWVEEAGHADRPGSPYVAGGKPAFDAGRAQTYVLLDYTRFGGKVLPQLVYMAWFSERPHEGPLDPYGGRLDGVVWRVTLAPDGEPLAYDTIHPCGCYHYFFPARPLARKPQEGFWLEPALVPQDNVGSGPLAVRVESGTHYVLRVVPVAEAGGAGPYPYAIASYGELTFLPDESLEPVSLFDPVSGLVHGSERLERWWLWPSGVVSPGTMRAWGRHATAFVGRRHFDDPFLLETVFEVPENF